MTGVAHLGQTLGQDFVIRLPYPILKTPRKLKVRFWQAKSNIVKLITVALQHESTVVWAKARPSPTRYIQIGLQRLPTCELQRIVPESVDDLLQKGDQSLDKKAKLDDLF